MRWNVLAALSLFVLFGVATMARAEEEANLKTMNRFYEEVCNQHKLAVIDELVSPDFVEHDTSNGMPPTREGLKQFFAMLIAAFPDMQFHTDYTLAKEDRVLWYGTMTGTQSGPLMGMPATNKAVRMNIFDMVRFEDGKAVEHWGVADALSMLMQLGMMPQPGMDGMGGAPPGSGK